MTDDSSSSEDSSERLTLPERVRIAWRILRNQETVFAAAIRKADEVPEEDADLGGRRRMLLRAAEFDTLRVKDVMIPRADIMALEVDTSFDEVFKRFGEEGVSRMPLYRGHLDDPIGLVHVKDVIAEMDRRMRENLPPLGADKVLMKLKRDVLFVPPSMRLSVLLVKMQSARCHLAMVIDEYGGTHGLLSIEDLVEQIVGDIEDEHDEAEGPLIVKGADGSWLADARTPLEDAAEAVGLPLGEGEWGEDVDTLGGLLASLAGRVPVRGEMIAHPAGIEFEVLDADPRRVKRLRIHQRADPAAAAPTSQTPPAA